jgi:bifunctional DNA-binding transcriptional regulator/antitoxin component of YhaV-PrlF toxin-antitoxin module
MASSRTDRALEQAASALRRQGATFAIICHTLGIPYRQAKALGRAYDRRAGHPPEKLKRKASEVSLPGYTVKDGAAAPSYGEPRPKGARTGTRISSKNQVTLPVAALAAAHLRAGDRLRVEAEGDGKIVLLRDRDPLDRFIGAIPGLSAAADLERLRNEWER